MNIASLRELIREIVREELTRLNNPAAGGGTPTSLACSVSGGAGRKVIDVRAEYGGGCGGSFGTESTGAAGVVE